VDRNLRDLGRRHFARCEQLVSSEGIGLADAVRQAGRGISVNTLRRANADADSAADFLHAIVEAGTSARANLRTDFLFNLSIFAAASAIELIGPLVDQTGEGAAMGMQFFMLTALKDERFEYIHGADGDLLDRIGQYLGQAYYRVFVRVLRVIAGQRIVEAAESKLAALAAHADVEATRMEARELLQLALEQCANDEEKTSTLNRFGIALKL